MNWADDYSMDCYYFNFYCRPLNKFSTEDFTSSIENLSDSGHFQGQEQDGRKWRERTWFRII